MNDRRIDKIRTAAGRMEIGTPEDQSNITTLISLENGLYAVKEHGIYVIRLADDIDPGRTNEKIPHVQQRIVALGSESPIVGKTFLTAKELFSEQVLPKEFDCSQAMLRALDALKDLAALQELKDSFIEAEDKGVSVLANSQANKGAFVLPAIGDVESRCKTFFQKADHSLRYLLDIVKLFYKDSQGIRGLADLIVYSETTYGSDDPFTKYLVAMEPNWTFVRETRNSLEHPHAPTVQATVADFHLRSDGTVMRPSIEVTYRGNRYPRSDLSRVMMDLAEVLPTMFEDIMAGLCSKNIQSVGGFTPFLMEQNHSGKPGWNRHVRYCYGININGTVGKLG